MRTCLRNTTSRRLVTLTAAVALAGLAFAEAGATRDAATCFIEPLDYTVLDSTLETDGDGKITGLRWTATAMATLSGPDCPRAGHTFTYREKTALVIHPPVLGGSFTTLRGRYRAEWDVNNDGVFSDAQWQGRITVKHEDTETGTDEWTSTVVAASPGGAKLTLEQTAVVDLDAQEPLVSLKLTHGEVNGQPPNGDVPTSEVSNPDPAS